MFPLLKNETLRQSPPLRKEALGQWVYAHTAVNVNTQAVTVLPYST